MKETITKGLALSDRRTAFWLAEGDDDIQASKIKDVIKQEINGCYCHRRTQWKGYKTTQEGSEELLRVFTQD
jgi:hypothetical protein